MHTLYVCIYIFDKLHPHIRMGRNFMELSQQLEIHNESHVKEELSDRMFYQG